MINSKLFHLVDKEKYAGLQFISEYIMMNFLYRKILQIQESFSDFDYI